MKTPPQHIVQLFFDSYDRALSSEEQRTLDQWLAEAEENRASYNLLITLLQKKIHAEVLQNIDVAKSWDKVDKATSPIAGWKTKPIRRYAKIAATLLIPTLLTGAVLHFIQTPGTSTDQFVQIPSSISPSPTVTLETCNGERIALDENTNQKIQNHPIIPVASNTTGRELSPLTTTGKQMREAPNKIVVPPGGFYKLELSDGTKITLNADSKLLFPNEFDTKERIVTLIGEGFFEVAKKDSPFFVHTATSTIQVFGTSFNVYSYHDGRHEKVSLVSGKVKVDYKDQEIFLAPGQQLTINKETRSTEIAKVDPDLYTSWLTNIYRFESITLEELTERLSHLYNKQFYFEEEQIKLRKLTGALLKGTDLAEYLKYVAASTGVSFSLKENRIHVRPYR